jgi:hypothetical protein
MCPCQPFVVTCPLLLLMARKCMKKSLWSSPEIFMCWFSQIRNQNPPVGNQNDIYIFSPWAGMDKLQCMVGMDKFSPSKTTCILQRCIMISYVTGWRYNEVKIQKTCYQEQHEGRWWGFPPRLRKPHASNLASSNWSILACSSSHTAVILLHSPSNALAWLDHHLLNSTENFRL